jgi:hypothetical protein
MGLLEDAIREHLELKRLRGADPTEVAREQHEALNASVAEEAAGTEGRAADNGTETAADPLAGEAQPAGEPADGAGTGQDLAHLGQETAELDMQAVLDDPGAEHGGAVEGAADDPAGAVAEDDSLEWEVPATTSRRAASSDPERRSSPEAEEHAGADPGDPQEGDSDPDRDAPQQGRLSL